MRFGPKGAAPVLLPAVSFPHLQVKDTRSREDEQLAEGYKDHRMAELGLPI